MIDTVHEKGEARNVGEQNEFLQTSQVRMPQPDGGERTCLTSLQICPTDVKNKMADIHSLWLRRVSRAKSWTWETSLSMRYFNLGSGHCEFILCTFSVILSIVKSFIGGIST